MDNGPYCAPTCGQRKWWVDSGTSSISWNNYKCYMDDVNIPRTLESVNQNRVWRRLCYNDWNVFRRTSVNLASALQNISFHVSLCFICLLKSPWRGLYPFLQERGTSDRIQHLGQELLISPMDIWTIWIVLWSQIYNYQCV